MFGYERLNRNVLMRERQILRVGEEVTSDGRPFQTEAPATGTARSPTVDSVTLNSLFSCCSNIRQSACSQCHSADNYNESLRAVVVHNGCPFKHVITILCSKFGFLAIKRLRLEFKLKRVRFSTCWKQAQQFGRQRTRKFAYKQQQNTNIFKLVAVFLSR